MSRFAYEASVKEFIVDVDTNQFMTKICQGALLNRIGGSESEKNSWAANAAKVRSLFSLAGVPDDVHVGFEYKSPLAGRVDCMVFGMDALQHKHVIHIELKQWSNNSVSQLYDTGVFEVTAFVGGQYQILSHPSQQALNYHLNILNYIPAVAEEAGTELNGFAYCYNYEHQGSPNDLYATQYEPVMTRCPLYGGDEVKSYAQLLQQLLASGKGDEVFHEFISSPVRPTKNLINAAANMMRQEGKQEFVLLDEQLTSSNMIFGMVEKALRNPFVKMCLIVKGGPGTGKTVIALHVIAELASKYPHLVSYFTTRSTALRDTLKAKLTEVQADGLIRRIFDFKPCTFKEGEVDVLLVDEAHRIQKSSNHFTDKKNEQSYLTQVMSLLYCAKVCVFFIDDHQGIKKEEIGLSSSIEDAARNYVSRLNDEANAFQRELAGWESKQAQKKKKLEDLMLNRLTMSQEEYLKKYEELTEQIARLQGNLDKRYQLEDVHSSVHRVEVRSIELKSQFRCNGSDNYLDWLDAVLYRTDRIARKIRFGDEYIFRVCASPQELEREIRSLDDPTKGQVARLVAGYCWDWSDKLLPNGDLAKDVKIGDWEMPWETKKNIRARGQYSQMYAPSAELWASHPKGINQVGCIFSAQGFEVDYIGVIMGPDIRYDTEEKKIVAVKGYTHSVTGSDFDAYIKNIYRVLLSRGRHGCMIYCCDKALADYFRSFAEG